jgi:cytochrome c2
LNRLAVLTVCATLAAGAGLAGRAQAPSSAGGSVSTGADIYSTRCAFCHGDGGVGGQGPRLIGVLGRKAGSLPGFGYTDALRASGLTWTPETLDRFLVDPGTVVPGTAMPMNVPDPQERRDVIAYLGSLH